MNTEIQHGKKNTDSLSGWAEWCVEDKLDSVGWAAVFVWGWLVLLADISGLASNFGSWDGWAVFFTGAGVLVLVGTVIRFLVPEFRRKLAASLVFGAVLLAIGLGDALDWIWPLILIGIGAVILRGLISRPR